MSYLPFARVQDAKSKHGAGMNLGRRLLEKILCGGSGSWAAAGVAARPDDIRIIMVIPAGFIPMGWPARSIPAARHAVA